MIEVFESINGVNNVTSLTNIELFTDEGDYLLSPVYESIPKSLDSLESSKDQILVIDDIHKNAEKHQEDQAIDPGQSGECCPVE